MQWWVSFPVVVGKFRKRHQKAATESQSVCLTWQGIWGSGIWLKCILCLASAGECLPVDRHTNMVDVDRCSRRKKKGILTFTCRLCITIADGCCCLLGRCILNGTWEWERENVNVSATNSSEEEHGILVGEYRMGLFLILVYSRENRELLQL